MRDDRLRHVDLADDRRLLLRELQHRDVPELGAVEVAVEPERADARRADEPLRVEEHVRRREHREVDLPAQKRRDVQPLDVGDAQLLLAPRLAERVHVHRPHARGVVRERERRRLAPDDEVERQPERLELAAEVDRLRLAALRDDPRVRAERRVRAAGMPRRAADARRAARDHVTREMPDDGELHGPEG